VPLVLQLAYLARREERVVLEDPLREQAMSVDVELPRGTRVDELDKVRGAEGVAPGLSLLIPGGLLREEPPTVPPGPGFRAGGAQALAALGEAGAIREGEVHRVGEVVFG